MADRMQQLLDMLESDPNDTFCLYGLAMECAKRDEHDKAIEWFDRVIAADPNYCYAYFHKARSQAAQDDAISAQRTLRTGIERAKAIGDSKALNELDALFDEYS